MVPQHFSDYQFSFPRVRRAAQQHADNLKALFSRHSLHFPPKQIHLRIFKQEQQLDVWATDALQYTMLKSYAFTATSGQAGPKQQEGDLQVPEGFYRITHFNPLSKFHLSLRINYPNAADILRNRLYAHPGKDIYIHGGDTSTGCIAIGDENMAELYWLCVCAFATNPFIPVHIFPFRMEAEPLKKAETAFPQAAPFWQSMLPAYQDFELYKILPEEPGHDNSGNYTGTYRI